MLADPWNLCFRRIRESDGDDLVASSDDCNERGYTFMPIYVFIC